MTTTVKRLSGYTNVGIATLVDLEKYDYPLNLLEKPFKM